MKCQDTAGETPAIHVSEEALKIAQQIEPVLESIRKHSHGEGQITLKVLRGKIPFIDWTFRTFIDRN